MAASYVDSPLIYRYPGQMLLAEQYRAWPRKGGRVAGGGPRIPEGTIPARLKLAQAQAALLARREALPTQADTGPGRPGELASIKSGDTSLTYADPTRVGGQSPSLQTMALGHPDVTSILLPILDDTYHEAPQASRVAGLASAQGGRPGSYFDLGMHDSDGAMHGPARNDWPRG